MTSVEKIRELCKQRGIAVSKLERDCGFSNGYIRGLRHGQLPIDKVARVAEYLNVPVSIFYDAPDEPKWYTDEKTASAAQELFERPGLRVLFDAARTIPDESLYAVADMITKLKEGNNDG